MGFWGAIGSFVSGAVSAISSAVGAIGSAVANVATGIAKLGMELAGKVGAIIKEIAVSLGIIKPEEDPEELGEAAMLSDKKPEDFDSMSDYIDHLRSIPVDKEKLAKMDKKELLARSAIGTSISLKAIEEKLDTSISPTFLATVAKQDMKANEVLETIKTYKQVGIKTEDYSRYYKGELNVSDTEKHADALVETYQKLEPDASREQIEDKIMDRGDKVL